MIIAEKYIYLELQKTGSSATRRLMTRLLKNEEFVASEAKHGGIRSFEKHYGEVDRPVLMGIRQPYSWYVSLFAFGCNNGGLSMYRQLDLTDAERGKIRDLYQDPFNIDNFREWMYVSNEFRSRGGNQFMNRYEIGLLTTRFLNMSLDTAGMKLSLIHI